MASSLKNREADNQTENLQVAADGAGADSVRRARVAADHTTIWRWVQCYGPELEQRLRRQLKPTNQSWRVDETYIRVQGPLVLPLSSHLDRFNI